MIGAMTRVAAIVALACALIASLWLFNGSTAPAFGDVIDKVVAAQSLSFRLRQRLGNQPVFVSRVRIGSDTMRMDMLGLEGPQEAVEKIQSEMQRLNLTAFVSVVGDFSQRETVQLDHLGKTYTRKAIDKGAVTEFASANVVEQFRNVKSEDANWLREESRDGQTLDVYLVTHVRLMGIEAKLAGTEGQQMIVRVDRKTGLPVEISLEASTDREGKSSDWFEFSDFTWNEPLDPSLFSLAVPEGYTPAAPIMPD